MVVYPKCQSLMGKMMVCHWIWGKKSDYIIICIYIYIFFLGCNMTEDVSVSDLNKLDAT